MDGVEKYAAPGPSPGVHDLDGGDFAETAKPRVSGVFSEMGVEDHQEAT